MNRLKLIPPTPEYEDQVMAYRAVFLAAEESLDGCAGLEDVAGYSEWLNFEARLKQKYQDQYVPSLVFLAVREQDDKLVGMIDFRHPLSDFLYQYGGSIGYSVLPAQRHQGYAKEMLALLLEKCKAMKVTRVLLTCDRENTASAKTILKNGGVLENEVADAVGLSHSGVIARYWITLN